MKDRRALILEAAERLLQHYGVQKTTVADIAREAQIGVGTVYLEFSSKDTIIAHLSKARYDLVLRAMRRAAMSEGDFAQRLRELLDARLDGFIELARRGAHAAELVHCSCDAVQRAQDVFDHMQRDLLTDFLDEAARCGEFDVPDPARAAETILLAYAHLSPPYIFRHDPEDAYALIDTLHDLILRGLLARS